MSLLLSGLSAFSALCFAASCVLLSLRRGGTCSRVLVASGAVCCLSLVLANGIAAAAPPLGNMRHVLCLLPIALLISGLWLRRTGVNAWAGIAGAAAVSLCGALFMSPHAEWRQPPALQSPWFIPHVASYVLAYALLTLSFVYALGARKTEHRSRLSVADALVRLAFPFLSFGLCSGMLWADAAWARYWAWDIKEVWSLITWSIYLIYFHTPPDAPARRALILLGFAAVLVTFVIVNFASPHTPSLHTY